MRALAAGIAANVPTLIWGPPGVGKTSVLTSYGKAWGMHTETIIGSIREPSDFLGLPIEDAGVVRYTALAWAKRLADAERGLLILDELTTSSPMTIKALLRVTQEREVGEFTLPGSVSIVAAANPADTAVDGWDLPAPMANRFMHLDWQFPVADWITGLQNGFCNAPVPSLRDLLGHVTDADRARLRGTVAQFLSVHDAAVLKVPTDATLAGLAWPSRRSWTNAVAVASELDPADEEALLLVLRGCVGDAVAIDFMAWRVNHDLYDPRAVLADPSTVDWRGDRPDQLFVLTRSITALAMADGKARTWTQAMDALAYGADHGKPDVAMPGASQLLQAIPDGGKVKSEWRAAFAQIMTRSGRWADAA